uniref:Tn4399 and related integrases n=1 Tax=uncultured Flavobacteriaceae bacterium TaxID=165436 RepID=Q2YZD8_9FLAO|nr:Tn4399 and related integrases [uncultured Flavobacteriaceae bacterium]
MRVFIFIKHAPNNAPMGCYYLISIESNRNEKARKQ